MRPQDLPNEVNKTQVILHIPRHNGQLNRLALERQRKRQSELKLLLGQQISDNVNS
jgi:hypothetical protein